jgi:hypothetical protein
MLTMRQRAVRSGRRGYVFAGQECKGQCIAPFVATSNEKVCAVRDVGAYRKEASALEGVGLRRRRTNNKSFLGRVVFSPVARRGSLFLPTPVHDPRALAQRDLRFWPSVDDGPIGSKTYTGPSRPKIAARMRSFTRATSR